MGDSKAVLGLVCGLLAPAGAALAQQPPQIEEIIVTAQKRRRDQRDHAQADTGTGG